MDAKKLRDIFDYKDGNLLWKIVRKGVNKDKIAGYTRPDGYRTTRVDGKSYLVHRLVFMYHNGFMPSVIDHIDGDPRNNKIENLRECTMAQNTANSKRKRTNLSGVKHVRWNKSCSKWQVIMQINGKQRHVGVYKDLELAELVAIEARNKYHGEFARHN